MIVVAAFVSAVLLVLVPVACCWMVIEWGLKSRKGRQPR